MSPTSSESRRPGGTDPHLRRPLLRRGRARRRRGLDTRPLPTLLSVGIVLLVVGAVTSFAAHVGFRAHGRAGLRRCRVVDSRRVRRRSGGGLEQRCRSGPGCRLDARRSALGLGCGHARDRPRGSDELAARVRGADGRRGGGGCAASGAGRPRTASGPGSAMSWPTRALRGWAISEVLAYAAWSGVLVYCGALFVESYGSSLAVVGLALGLGAAAYIPGTFVAQRVSPARSRPLLAAAGCYSLSALLAFGIVRMGPASSAIGFGALCFARPGPGHIWGVPSGSTSQQASTPRPCRSAPPRPRSAGS